MRATIVFFTFFVIKKSYVIFDWWNFLFEADQSAQFSLRTCLRLTQFSYTKIGNFPDDFLSLNEVHNFIHRYRQLSCQFYVSEQVPSFYTLRYWSLQKFWCLEWDTQFLSSGYFAFSGYPIKKKHSTNRCSMISLVQINNNNKNWESWKVNLCKNSATVLVCSLKVLLLGELHVE